MVKLINSVCRCINQLHVFRLNYSSLSKSVRFTEVLLEIILYSKCTSSTCPLYPYFGYGTEAVNVSMSEYSCNLFSA